MGTSGAMGESAAALETVGAGLQAGGYGSWVVVFRSLARREDVPMGATSRSGGWRKGTTSQRDKGWQLHRAGTGTWEEGAPESRAGWSEGRASCQVEKGTLWHVAKASPVGGWPDFWVLA